MRLENATLIKSIDEKQRVIDSLKERIKRSKETKTSHFSSSSVGSIQNIKSRKVLQLPQVFSIEENPAVDVSVSSTGSDIKRRLQASLKIYPTEEASSMNQSSELYRPRPVQPDIRDHQERLDSSQQTPISTWVNRAPHLAQIMASYKPEDNPKPHLPIYNFPPLFANPYMGQFSISSTAVPSNVSTPTGVRTPVQQQNANWQIPQPVLFGLAPHSMYINRSQN